MPCTCKPKSDMTGGESEILHCPASRTDRMCRRGMTAPAKTPRCFRTLRTVENRRPGEISARFLKYGHGHECRTESQSKHRKVQHLKENPGGAPCSCKAVVLGICKRLRVGVRPGVGRMPARAGPVPGLQRAVVPVPASGSGEGIPFSRTAIFDVCQRIRTPSLPSSGSSSNGNRPALGGMAQV